MIIVKNNLMNPQIMKERKARIGLLKDILFYCHGDSYKKIEEMETLPKNDVMLFFNLYNIIAMDLLELETLYKTVNSSTLFNGMITEINERMERLELIF